MDRRLKYHDILYNDARLGPFPMELLKRVDRPTTAIPGPVERRFQREHALNKARKGDYGPRIQEQAPRMIDKYPLGAAIFENIGYLRTVNRMQDRTVREKAPLPEDPRALSRHMKSLGYFLGADIMGICRLPASAVYLDDRDGNPLELDSSYQYAIVFVKRKHLPSVNASSGYDWIFDALSHQTYQVLGTWTITAANYIRRLGYKAEASCAASYTTLMTPLLLEAGIGEISRMGIVLNPFLGANFKAAAVLTDLPLLPDGPVDFGLQKYCARCTICADNCPSKAIPYGGKTLYNGYETWKLDEKKCTTFDMLNRRGSICGRCTKICPWNRPETEPHHFADWNGDIAELHRRADARAEYLKEHNFRDERELTDKWWLDLEEVDGKLVIPKLTEFEDE